ncbi:MAG: hypothetical protein EOO57_19790, partial [Hymenobacter sp.]
MVREFNTKDLNAVYFQNVNLPYSTVNAQSSATDANSGDRRPIFYNTNAAGIPTTARNRIYGPVTLLGGLN